MTNWTPSEGLKRADAVVAEIEQAMEACGVVPPDGMPMRAVLGHRLTEIVAAAIDGVVKPHKAALDMAMMDQFERALETKANGLTNGHTNVHAKPLRPNTPQDKAMADAWAKEDAANGIVVIEEAADGSVTIYPTGLPAKKRKGRPLGSTNKAKAKKAKPTKADKAQEAPPAAE